MIRERLSSIRHRLGVITKDAPYGAGKVRASLDR